MTTEQAYAIAPLVWEQPQLTWVAQSIFGEFYTASYSDPKDRQRYVWLARLDTGTVVLPIASGLPSLEAAQLAAEAWHRERILPALIPIPTNHNEGEV